MFCANCGVENKTENNFCNECGKRLGSDSQHSARRSDVSDKSGNTKVRHYNCTEYQFSQVRESLIKWLNNEEFDCQEGRTEEGNVLIQITSRQKWKQFIGMSTALNIVMQLEKNRMKVEIGFGKWIDKLATGGISIVVLWPLAVTTAAGTYLQLKMPQRIFDYIDANL